MVLISPCLDRVYFVYTESRSTCIGRVRHSWRARYTEEYWEAIDRNWNFVGSYKLRRLAVDALKERARLVGGAT